MGISAMIATTCSWTLPLAGAQQILYRNPDPISPVSINGTTVRSWTSGQMQVVHVQGAVEITQGSTVARGDEGIILIGDDFQLRTMAGETIDEDPDAENPVRPKRVITYLESNVSIDLIRSAAYGEPAPSRIEEQRSWMGRFVTDSGVRFPAHAQTVAAVTPPIFERAQAALDQSANSGTQQVQFLQDGPATQQLVSPLTGQIQTVTPQQAAPDWPPAATQQVFSPLSTPQTNGNAGGAGGIRNSGRTHVEITARDSTVDLNLKIYTNPANANERIHVASGGARVSVESPALAAAGAVPGQSNTGTILADNIVAWQSSMSDGDSRWEIYLEGNVVYVQGTRTIYADRMYYDANMQRGTILDADMLTPMQSYDGLVRLRSDVIQQMDANTMEAFGPAMTTSRIGVPRYWLQSDRLTITKEQRATIDPASGLVQSSDEYFADSRNNRVYVAGTPVFYWPRFRTSLNDPTLYLDRVRVGNDRIFGTQIMTGWNLFQVLGIRNRPENTRWIGVVDYLSDRGLGFGTELDYQREGLLGYPGRAEGFSRTWFINDSGLDNLGRDRTSLVPEAERRGNILARHRHRFSPGVDFRAELGYLSDRNFLEQYYERRWDTEKDYTTGVWLSRNVGTQSFNLIADAQINDFFTQTSWLPRLDHFVLGQPLLGDRLVWHGHSSVGYARFRPANSPLDPADLAPFDLLAWESADTNGVRATTRQEIDMPLQVGPVKVVPYVLGDVSYWQEALDNNDLLRGYGQTGVRFSVPFWKVDPTIQSTMWNVNGLAHKISLEAEFLYADSSQNLDELPLYDPLDDDSQEAFRHRLAFNTFGIPKGGDVPLKYDERYYAFRRGMQGWVTGAVPEIAEDMAAIKLGARQRLQTKRGLPGRERIIDWITLDTQVVLFPEADRDNFGSTAGLLEYDFRWHLGDRVSLVSDGMADFYSEGLKTASLGVQLGRPSSGNIYVGYRSIEGPISSNIVNANLQYRMSDKWGFRANTAVDFGDTGTIGHTFSLIYIGESFLWRVGANADTSRDNIGFVFGFEPRFIGRSRSFNPGGVSVGPAGSKWLE